MREPTEIVVFPLAAFSLAILMNMAISQKTSMELVKERKGLAKQCYAMLHMGNFREGLAYRAYAFNEKIDDLQWNLAHPIKRFWVHESVANIQPISCGLEGVI